MVFRDKAADGTTRLTGGLSVPSGRLWANGVTYATNDVVGYAGRLWCALAASTGKPPAFFGSLWTPVSADDRNIWSDIDPNMENETVTHAWELFWHSGATTTMTTTSGEFESGSKAMKIALNASSSQRFYTKDENIILGGETLEITVRAKALTNAINLEAALIQNTPANPPDMFQTGVQQTSGGTKSVVTSGWNTYTFAINALANKPRAKVNFIASSTSAGTLLIDWVKIRRIPAGIGGAITRNTAISMANGWSKITFNGTDFLEGIDWDGTNQRFVVTSPGLYSINGAIMWASNATGRRGSAIYVNGVMVRQILDPAGTDIRSTAVNVVRNLAVGDTIELYGWQSSGAALTTFAAGSATWLEVAKLNGGA